MTELIRPERIWAVRPWTRPNRRIGFALVASGAAHLALGVALLTATWRAAPEESAQKNPVAVLFEAPAVPSNTSEPRAAPASPVEPTRVEPAQPDAAAVPDQVEAAPVPTAPEAKDASPPPPVASAQTPPPPVEQTLPPPPPSVEPEPVAPPPIEAHPVPSPQPVDTAQASPPPVEQQPTPLPQPQHAKSPPNRVVTQAETAKPVARAAAGAASAEPQVSTPATSASPSKSEPQPPSAVAGWNELLSAWLAAHKHYPEVARQRSQEGIVTLRFTVAADGNVVEVEVVTGSGSPLLDQAAQEMLRGAKLPAPGTELTRTVRLRYRLED
jgi:periplasmic protein TonB